MNMKLLAASLAATLLSACVSILPEAPPAPYIYTMRVGAVEPSTAPAHPLVIIIGAPSAQRMTAGSDIVWRQGAEIAVMDRAAWDDAAPDLLQTMLTETLSRRGVFRAAVRGGAGARGDIDLRWDVLAFEVVEDGGLEAVFSTTVRLVDARSRTIIDTRRFDTRAPIANRSAREAVAALERAAREACLQITEWAAEKAPAPLPPPVVSGAPSQPSAASIRR
ncbi:MAG: membrane integrity-associated transporter subunit PqiC [Hyphomonadaceae bacterium]|nr:MAG: ABC transporter [Caulobacteraceae bacterium]MBT9446393.1 membrane integrity-associated transporter subunit PqiC [Hyphomonadaceae bacterium]TPW07886.1 MAG: ABC transporter [Alphaproteobacteria bacterium]